MAQTIIVDTTPGYRMPTIYYSQGDIGRTFSIDLQSRFGESLPASPTITIQATKPSGLGFSVASTSISGAVVTFTVTETMSNEAGRFPAELKIVKNSVTLFTANFYIDCEANAHPEGTTDGDIDHIMPKFMSVTTTTLPAGDSATYSFDANTNTATFGIPKGADGSLASQVLAADYSSSKTYAVGDYVYYSGNLYRCTTAITTAEAWTSGHWTQVALGDDVTDIKSDLTTITGNERIQFSNPTEKKYINLLADPVSFTPNVATVANVKYAIVSCSEGDKFTINGTGGGGDRLWAFVDSSKHILVKADSSATANNLVLTAPENATHLIVNDENDQVSYIGTLVKDELHRIGNIVDKTAEYNPLSPYASATGVLKTDGTIYTGASSTINKYRDVAGRELYLNGEGGFDTTYGFCYVWFVKNGVMDSYIASTAKPQYFDRYLISVASDIDEVWVNRSVSIDLMELTAVDQYARNKIDEIINAGEVGAQWYGKKWYAYGTSMTSVHEGTGKYPPFVADFSGLILTEKGIGGGGICNNTLIKNAVMNVTDGKLEADLITLEIGANDTTAPLGTIYDTGGSTFCGALNQCIRYLQANTSAQIVVISSTNARQNSGGTSASPEVTYGTDNHTKYDQWEATRKVCEINSCYYIPMGEDANMSWARMNASNAYNSDEIHHTALGGYNLALFVWYQLRNIPCWFTSIPS